MTTTDTCQNDSGIKNKKGDKGYIPDIIYKRIRRNFPQESERTWEMIASYIAIAIQTSRFKIFSQRNKLLHETYKHFIKVPKRPQPDKFKQRKITNYFSVIHSAMRNY